MEEGWDGEQLGDAERWPLGVMAIADVDVGGGVWLSGVCVLCVLERLDESVACAAWRCHWYKVSEGLGEGGECQSIGGPS